MSNLETAAAPVLGPLVDGEHRVLDVQQQSIAAAWGIKTTMVFEHTLSDPSAVYWNDDERKQFARTAQVPQETVVTIAGYAGISLAYSIGGARQLTGIASDEPLAKGFRGTLVVGHLVLQVEADRWQATTGRMGLWWPPKHADQSEWIFPSQHAQVQFPPGRMLNDAEVHAFGE